MANFNTSITVRLINGFTGPAAAMQASMRQLHRQTQQLRHGFLGLRQAMVGSFALMMDNAFIHGLGKIIVKGNELVKIQRYMAIAGMKNTEVADAYLKAWKLTGKYQNMGAVEVLKMMNDARMIFGSNENAIHHIEPFVKYAAFLKAYQGNGHGGASSDGLLKEVISGMQSGEIAGKITPEEMDKHFGWLTAMKVAYGERVNIKDYLTAQRAGGVALRNVGDEFRYGIFSALVQENGSNAGVMMMTAFNKIFAGVGNRTKSLENMVNLGILDPKYIEYAKSGHAKGLKPEGFIKDYKLFGENPAEWVWSVLKPALAAKTKGMSPREKALEESRLISRILPDRNAAKAITELLQQEYKLRKNAEKTIQTKKSIDRGLNSYIKWSFEDQLQAVREQFGNLIKALGASVNIPATSALRKLSKSLNHVAEAFKKHPTAAKYLMYSFAGLSTGIALVGSLLIGRLMWSLVRLSGVIGMVVAPFRLLGATARGAFGAIRFVAGGIGSIASGAAFGALIARLGALRFAFMRLGTFGLRYLLGPLGLLATLLYELVPSEWWSKGAEFLRSGFEVLKGIVSSAVDQMVSKLAELKHWLTEGAFRDWMLGKKSPEDIKADQERIKGNLRAMVERDRLPDAALGVGVQGRRTYNAAADIASRVASTVNQTISQSITVNVGTAMATPAAIAGAVGGAGRSLSHELKGTMADGAH